jgi:VanZ family protein
LLPPKSTINLGNQDKISHYIAYFFLTINALLITQKRKHILAIFLVILYGIIIECLQSFIPGRFPSYNDIIANSLGTLSGLIIILIGSKKINQSGSLGA